MVIKTKKGYNKNIGDKNCNSSYIDKSRDNIKRIISGMNKIKDEAAKELTNAFIAKI